MEDTQIIDLYWRRDETAIAETARKYGRFCYGLAKNILSVHEDAEECVSDAYQQAWRSIPPQRPVRLGAWLGRVIRNGALNLWNKNHRQKRDAGLTTLLSELEDCIPSPQSVERAIEAQELSKQIGIWLRGLDRDDRVLFVRRYWYGDPLAELARARGVTPGRLAQRMSRLRSGLRTALEQEDILL